MNINEMLNQNANVQLVISAAELKESFMEWMKELEEKNRPKQDDMIPTDEVTKLLKVSVQTVWRWQKNGIITPVKIGRIRYFRRADIDRILENGVS